MRRLALLPCLAATAAALLLATGALANPEEPPKGGMPPPPRKFDSALATSLVGEWTWTSQSTSMGESKGTSVFRLALLDTALVEDVAGTTSMGPFEGTAVTRFSPDGKSVKLWWFSSMVTDPEAFTGTLGPDGWDVSSPTGGTMSLKKTATGLEMKASKQGSSMTVTYAKK